MDPSDIEAGIEAGAITPKTTIKEAREHAQRPAPAEHVDFPQEVRDSVREHVREVAEKMGRPKDQGQHVRVSEAPRGHNCASRYAV